MIENASKPTALIWGQNTAITHNSSSASTTFVDIPASTFTIPSAGNWEVNFCICFWNSQGNSQIAIHDSSNVVVANSYLQIPTTTNFITHNLTAIINTTGSKTFKLRWKTSLGTMFIGNNTSGNSRIIWKKLD